ncbi:hypothetical protein [Saccharothrix texasensis]|uniref:Condensation domain-containing protein n=1 Tax=Saccharothrix texasensis TaxID=103734 RepID=A0A3N1GX86_9PSEU|nr:hypothetical protein [Saccharothrix texasensis]ROP34933.1 hypothetical protein EDD40_0142 [Saccharothrix texasensis]
MDNPSESVRKPVRVEREVALTGTFDGGVLAEHDFPNAWDVLEFDGVLDLDRLRQALAELVGATWRTHREVHLDGRVRSVPGRSDEPRFTLDSTTSDAGGLREVPRAVLRQIREVLYGRYDLLDELVCRAHCIVLPRASRSYLALCFDHSIMDGYSLHRFVGLLADLYGGQPLSPSSVQLPMAHIVDELDAEEAPDLAVYYEDAAADVSERESEAGADWPPWSRTNTTEEQLLTYSGAQCRALVATIGTNGVSLPDFLLQAFARCVPLRDGVEAESISFSRLGRHGSTQRAVAGALAETARTSTVFRDRGPAWGVGRLRDGDPGPRYGCRWPTDFVGVDGIFGMRRFVFNYLPRPRIFAFGPIRAISLDYSEHHLFFQDGRDDERTQRKSLLNLLAGRSSSGGLELLLLKDRTMVDEPVAERLDEQVRRFTAGRKT